MENNKEKQYQKPQPERERTKKGGLWGIVGGGLLGILGFGISGNEFFILSPFVFGILGFLVGFIMDKKVEIDKRRKIFENKT